MPTALNPKDSLLSYTQESLWLFHQLAHPDQPAYNETLAFELAGKVDAEALRAAAHATLIRHEALRTRFHETKDGPRAEVVDSVPDTMAVVDLRDLEADEARAQAGDLLADHCREPFDLGKAPLVRMMLVSLPGDSAYFSVTAHHIVIDDWSLRLILEEIGENYRGLVESGQLPRRTASTTGFRDHVRTTREAFDNGDYAEKIESWRRSLEGSPELLGLPLDRPRPAGQTFRGSSLTVTVPRTDVDPLLNLCRRECRSTAFPVFLAAYAALLNRYTGQDESVIGTTVLNRLSEEDLTRVGCYVNTLPIALSVDQDAPFRRLLASAQDAMDRVLDDGDAPYPKVLEAVGAERAVNYNPVFQTMLTLLGPQPALELGLDVTSQYLPIRRAAAKFDLMLYISQAGDEYEFEAEFNTDLFDRDTAERILRNYAQLLKSLAADIDIPVGKPSMLRDDEARLILGTWNDTAVEYPTGTVVDTIEERVRQSPESIAVEFDGQVLTYDALNRRANQLGRLLRSTLGEAATQTAAAAATEAGPFIGVYMERSVEMVVALLAIVKAGYAYVPIDPDYPAARIAFMIEDAGLPLILTQQRHRGLLDTMGATVLVLPDLATDAEDDSNISRDLGPDSPVYMIYTSGSTGQPKGVINRHVSLFNRLYWMQDAFHLSGNDKVLQKTPYSFDVSVWEFFWPLMFGAAIVVAKPEGHRDPEYLKQVIRDYGVTTLHFVPSMLNVFLEEQDLAEYCGSLRQVFCSGEALPRKTMEVFFQALSCELHNLYGPTEAAIDVSHWPCTLDYPGDIVPIGKPIANVKLYVMDRNRQLQPVGVPGELCIGGVALASGYHRRDELSSKVFVEDPYGTEIGARLYRTGDQARYLADGQIQYLGRIDNQVKLRGVRIEPDEVAAVLRELPGVKDAAVIVRTTGATQSLVAYLVAAELDPDDVRSRLRHLLPEFLVPHFIVGVPDLPTTPNGKLDRRALPDPVETGARRAVAAPLTTPRERDVARVWAEVLGVDEVGADSGFFALGGDSILALKVASRLREAGYAAQIRDVFAHPTVSGLAAALEVDPDRAGASQAAAVVPAFALVEPEDRALLPEDAEDAWPLARLQAGMIYHTLLDEKSPLYHDIFDYEIIGQARPDLIRDAVQDTVARHAQLRSSFDLVTYSEPLQIVAPSAEVALEIVDLTHLDRAQQDQAIDEWVEREKQNPFTLDTPPIRFGVHVRAQDRMNLGISFHHLILDGWSVASVVEEIRSRYAQLLTGRPASAPAMEPGYGTYVALERETARSAEHRDAWRTLLDGFPATLLAGPPSLADGAVAPAAVERIVPPDLENRLRQRAAALGVPLKSLYLAAHCTALAQITGTTRLITGLVGNGRPEIPGGSEMVGLFLNTIPFPVELSAAAGAGLPEAVFEQERALLPHQGFPLAEIERLHGGMLFDTVFNYTDFHVYADTDDDSVRIDRARYFELTSFPMVVHVHMDQFDRSMELAVCHDSARIETATAARFLDEFSAALTALVTPPAEEGAVTGPERAVAEIIAKAIDIATLGVDENYLDAGVDSITSIRILVKLRKLFPAAAMRDVIEMRTVRALVGRLQSHDEPVAIVTATQSPVTPQPTGQLPDGVVDSYPATALQLLMIEATRRDPAQSAYHDVFSFTVALPLNEGVLRAVLKSVIDSCETLRTAFALEDAPAPLQLVYESIEPDLTVVEAIGNPGAADEWFERERGSGFVWDQPGLIRFAAHRTAPAGFVLSLSFHHSIIDGWSLSLLVRDLMQAYAAGLSDTPLRLPARPALTYRDYVRAEAAAQSSPESQAYWRELLGGHPGTVLPRYRPDATGNRWTETTVAAPLELEARLRSVAQEVGCPLKHLMLAAHLRVLSLVTGETDVVTGVFTHGRLEAEEADSMIGLFLNFQPHRARLHSQTWTEFIEEVFTLEASALPHRRYPLSAIHHDLGRAQLFPALFNYTEFPAYSEVAEDGGYITGVRWFEHTDVPFLANVGRDISQARLEVTVNADGRLLPQEVTDTIARLYLAVLTQIAARPGARVTDISDDILAAGEILRTRHSTPEGKDQESR